MNRFVAAGLLAAALAGPASGQQRADDFPKPVQPEWEKRPTAMDISAVYPQRAANQEKSGQAIIKCLVIDDGLLGTCEVVSEQPAGYGFGTAALRLKSRFKIKSHTPDGAAVAGAFVNIPIIFKNY